MTKQVLFNGTVLIRAGGATKVDASAFQNVGVTGVGVVGVIGEAEAGEPNTVYQFRRPEDMVDTFKSGALADAADIAFRPMNDVRVPGGASSVLAVKVNQSTQAYLWLKKSLTNEMKLTSLAYGAQTNKISAKLSSSGGGKQFEFVSEDGAEALTETSPVLGATAEFTVKYNGLGSACTLTVTNTQITTTVTGGPGGENLTIPFSTYKTLTEVINYINGSVGGVYTATAITRNPFTFSPANLDYVTDIDIATSTASFYAQLYRLIEWVNANSSLVSAERAPYAATGPTPGSVTGTGLAPFNLEPNQTLEIDVNGGGAATATFTATAATKAGSGATYATLSGLTVVFEIDNDGDDQTVTFTAGATDAATTAAEFNAQARKCRMVVNGAEVDIVSDLRGTDSEVDIKSGTALTAIGHSAGAAVGGGLVANIDAVTHAEAKSIIEGAVAGMTYTPASGSGTPAVLTTNSSGSTYTIQVTAGTARTIFGFDTTLHSGTDSSAYAGTEAPDDSGPEFLSGGSRGVSSNSNWQAAFDLLGQVRVNEIVPLASEDLANEGYGSTATIASIIAMADAHAAYYSSTKGKNERQAYLGLKGNKTYLLDTAGSLQSPHTLVTGQYVTRTNSASETVQMPAWAFALIAAAGRAGSNLGEPLVFKNIRASGLTQDASWNPLDDGEDLILGGVTFAFAPQNQGYKFDRVITTYTKLDNDAYTEESIVMGWKNVSYGLRTQMEDIYTGVRGLPATVSNMTATARDILEIYRQEGQIVDSRLADGSTLNAYRDLKIVLDGDIARLSAIISPVSGINFQLNTLFLVPAVIAG